ncbi:DUF4368 domain-containing protein [Paenibacillus barengoltzii]|uniref:DUF4368 domain-containing protein n=1 Tax=Paenibacillus barengoltzii TaxID=343517 RepID=UPI001FCAB362|nr:DUF4368 domain-containing protein [Paenibacillus barengoltzii]
MRTYVPICRIIFSILCVYSIDRGTGAYDESLQIQDDTLAFSQLKNSLEEFLLFDELTPEILHRLIDRIEIKAEGAENLLQILGPLCLFFTSNYQRTAFHM